MSSLMSCSFKIMAALISGLILQNSRGSVGLPPSVSAPAFIGG